MGSGERRRVLTEMPGMAPELAGGALVSHGKGRIALVDVICSARNAGAQLAITIESVLSQSFGDFRLVIIDDGSDDEVTGRVIEQAAARDRRVLSLRNSESRGLTANLVCAVSDSDAEFIARIDAGDIWRPHKLDQQVSAMRADNSLVMVGTQCDYVARDGTVLGRSNFAEKDEEIREAFVTGKGIFTHSSILFRRVVNYRPEFRYSQDLDLYLRASESGRLMCLPEALTECLIDATGITLRRKYLQRKYQALAYRSYFSRRRGRGEIDLNVTDGRLERGLWHLSMPFYRRYIEARTRNKGAAVWGAYLAASLILFPPLLLDYVKRALRIAR